MVRIRFAEISGLYSYGNEKSRINFGERTVIVGTNNTGKSSIFKALNFFLRSLTESVSQDQQHWDLQDVHKMTVGLTLDDKERRYVAEILSVSSLDDSAPFSLAPSDVVEWLVPRLEQVNLTIRWHDILSPYNFRPIEYTLRLEELGIAVCASGYNGNVWVIEHPKFPLQHEQNQILLYKVIMNMMEADSAREELRAILGQQSARVSKFSSRGLYSDAKTAFRDKNRAKFVEEMSGKRTSSDAHSFFVMLGDMLEQRFTFVSERRNFLESNDLEKLPIKDDGSNLQSSLFWLQNGSKDKQNAYSAIQKRFETVLGQQNISFAVSVIERPEQQGQSVGNLPKIYPDRATILFTEPSEQGQKSTDFMSIGAGIRETLFLLTRCFERRDGVILLDEPVTNLHPTQIRRLMDEILTPNGRNGGSGQVVIITHSPLLASREMLSSVNEIARIDRPAYSRIVQPSKEGKDWIEKNLATFHLLKSDILFAKKVVLVEGWSDRIFLEAILSHGVEREAAVDDIVVMDVGGSSSFKKFRDFLGIFEIPFVILADNDAIDLFDVTEVLRINPESLSQADDGDKIVYLLEKDLEHCLSCLEPNLHKEITRNFDTKPEQAYHFVTQFFAESDSSATRDIIPLRHLKEWIMKDAGSAGQQGAVYAAP